MLPLPQGLSLDPKPYCRTDALIAVLLNKFFGLLKHCICRGLFLDSQTLTFGDLPGIWRSTGSSPGPGCLLLTLVASSRGKCWRVLSCCVFFWYQKKKKERETGCSIVAEAYGLWGSEVAESSALQRP